MQLNERLQKTCIKRLEFLCAENHLWCTWSPTNQAHFFKKKTIVLFIQIVYTYGFGFLVRSSVDVSVTVLFLTLSNPLSLQNQPTLMVNFLFGEKP